jgi:hypothetical protein
MIIRLAAERLAVKRLAAKRLAAKRADRRGRMVGFQSADRVTAKL